MTGPQGHWRIVANGYKGDLDISTDAAGNVSGKVRIDNPTIDPIHGYWDDAEQRLIFQRQVQAAGGSPQNYTGYLFEASNPLFQDGTYGPPTNPTFRVLAGNFDSYGTGGSGERPLFAWVARQNL